MKQGSLKNRKAATGDVVADFEAFYREGSLLMIGFFVVQTGSEAFAKDIVQTAFLKGWRSLHAFKGTASIKTWMYTIAMNVFRDECRRRAGKTQEPLDERLPAAELSPAAEQARNDLHAQVRRAVGKLEEKYRVPLTLARYENMSYEEIAAITKVPVSTVRMRIYHAHRLLAEALKPLINEGES